MYSFVSAEFGPDVTLKYVYTMYLLNSLVSFSSVLSGESMPNTITIYTNYIVVTMAYMQLGLLKSMELNELLTHTAKRYTVESGYQQLEHNYSLSPEVVIQPTVSSQEFEMEEAELEPAHEDDLHNDDDKNAAFISEHDHQIHFQMPNRPAVVIDMVQVDDTTPQRTATTAAFNDNDDDDDSDNERVHYLQPDNDTDPDD